MTRRVGIGSTLAVVVAFVGAAGCGAAGTGALVAEWAKGTVLRVSLDRSGTSSSGRATPFLTGVHNPVALLLTPEGQLLVGDWTTGRIYEISAR